MPGQLQVKSIWLFRCNPPPALLAECCSNTGVKHTQKETAHKINSGEEKSSPVPAEIQTHNFSKMSLELYKQAIWEEILKDFSYYFLFLVHHIF